MTSNACRQCSADVSVLRLDRLEGEDSGIRVTMEGLPALNCSNGHRRFTSPDFPMEFIKRLIDSEALEGVTPAVKKGVFRKRLHCPSCGARLPDDFQGFTNGRARVEVPQGDPVAVEVAVPLYRCPGCDREVSAHKPGLEQNIMQAVANAFRSADIPPG